MDQLVCTVYCIDMNEWTTVHVQYTATRREAQSLVSILYKCISIPGTVSVESYIYPWYPWYPISIPGTESLVSYIYPWYPISISGILYLSLVSYIHPWYPISIPGIPVLICSKLTAAPPPFLLPVSGWVPHLPREIAPPKWHALSHGGGGRTCDVIANLVGHGHSVSGRLTGKSEEILKIIYQSVGGLF